MSFHELVHSVMNDTVGTSLWAFRPELVVCGTIVAILLAQMLAPRWKSGSFYVMLIGTATALWLAIPWNLDPSQALPEPVQLFTGLLVFDLFSIYMRCLLLLFVLLFTVFTQLSGVPNRDDAGEFYVLVLGATLGMCLMVSANHMLIVFLGVEMASVPSYVLAGFLRNRRPSSEAALKYAVFGAGTAGVMLYGISLLVGTIGSAHLPTMAVRLSEMLLAGEAGDQAMVLVLGGLMVMVGLAFKLSAVPFHFWAPDVFEGATAEVGAFLSIASKAAALALLVRLTMGLGYFDQSLVSAPAFEDEPVRMITSHVTAPSDILFLDDGVQLVTRLSPEVRIWEIDSTIAARGDLRHAERIEALAPVRSYMAGLIGLLAAITCTFGNLAAYGQTNIKRLLAYSTIAHAGYMMMAVAAAVTLIGRDREASGDAIAAMAFYLAVYLFMNLGAFSIVAVLRNAMGSEMIADYAGLVRRSPGLAVCMALVLFSLIGLPPLAGFAAKFTIFASVYDAGLMLLLLVGGLNTVLSLFYYLRVVKVMALDPEQEGRPAPCVPLLSTGGTYCLVIVAPLILLFVAWGGLFEFARAAASSVLF